LEYQFGPVGMEILRGIKKVFDPKNLFNPGKVITL
jgi:glycolate oxidase/D-lactate dehydrogenase